MSATEQSKSWYAPKRGCIPEFGGSRMMITILMSGIKAKGCSNDRPGNGRPREM
jgi:hypothetical protein